LEIFEVLMVALYEDLMVRSLEVVAPLLQSLHDGQELSIVRVVVLFGTCAFPRVEVDWSENPETVILVENAGYGQAACIGLQNNRLCRVEMVENWCIGEGPFQLLKRKFDIPSPFPFDLFRRPGVFCFL
jgi:hypothetical protein